MNINERKNLSIISDGTILDSINNQIYEISEYEPNKNINVYIGIFHLDKKHIRDNGLNVGIQTEHMRDISGRKLWGDRHYPSLLYHISKYDQILDLSYQNMVKYKYLPYSIKEDIHFGPYIFPDSPISIDSNPNSKILYIGSLNERRKRIIRKINKNDIIEIVPPGTFGEQLYNKIRESDGLLNIHYDNGIYNEYPRFLLSLLFGKNIYSEQLAPPLIPDYHYISLSAIGHTSSENKESIYYRMADLLCTKYSFDEYISSIDKERTGEQISSVVDDYPPNTK